MATRITIESLKHIRRLEFSIPNAGVWLLTGANGTGKSTLLACMRRIGYSNAFPTHFPASQKSDRLDSFEGSSVRYEVDGATVTYRYRGERWVPLPKANSRLLRNAGFPSVRYIAADAKRIEPSRDDFQPRRVRPAHGEIIAAANMIFDTEKFHALKTINLRKGVGSDAFLLELPPVPGTNTRSYFSEKNLSLGELCILKLLRLLRDCPRGSLVLIDELELALHPMAQVMLLRYLDNIAGEKALTIIVSTHSATLIKQANANRLLLLQDDGTGNIVCQEKCFPSLVLGALAYREEAASDVIVYVEDEAAQVLVEQLALRFMQQVFQNQLSPSIQVIPVGGITNVLRFFVRQRPLLPVITRCYVMLDADGEQGLNEARAEDIIRIREHEREVISFLPVTPEVGLAAFLNASIRAVQDALRAHYRLQISVLQRDVGLMPAAADRAACKALVDRVCVVIAQQLPNISRAEVKVTLLKLLADHLFLTDRARVMQLMGPVIRG